MRAFGWTSAFIEKNDDLLNTSQNPAYLLAMIQMWLQSVLHWIIAILATVLVALATQLRSSAGFTSIGLISLMSIGEYLGAILISWTSLETSIGAVSRLKRFSEDVKGEDLPGEDQECPELWPKYGELEIVNVSASYRLELPILILTILLDVDCLVV
jgi:ATP-binding cassette subfamily C (CFTR/MRP) protein 1